MPHLINFIPPRFRSTGTAFLHDLLMVPLAWLGAYWLRFNLETIPDDYLQAGLFALLILLPVQAATFLFLGLYRGIWRFSSLPDLLRILKAIVIGTAIAMVILFLITRGVGIPRSVPLLHALLLVILLSGPRLLYRWLKDHHLYLSAGQRVLIVGSGKAGEMLTRDILRNRREAFQPIAFADDNRRRHKREIHGIPVAGACQQIPGLVREHEIDLIMIAIPSATSKQMRRVVEYCEQAGVPFRSVPQLQDLMSGNVQINQLREVSIEDLLGREPVSLDWPEIRQALAGKRILVTGAGGSIGSELCRQLAALGPAQLVLFENSEFNLYTIEMELRQHFPQLNLAYQLGDVTDAAYLNHAFDQHRPQVVFHAAAYKHVPMLEPQLRQALRNNVLGTQNVALAAHRCGCSDFVLVSTDKAVNPANIMGASKRAAEIFCQNLNRQSQTRFITVRFGNVLGSAGSVIPLFRQQIASGGPLTVTDPRMERYFMTIPEACQLIMQTMVLGQGGEIFVLDMGEPVKISYLAEQMIRLSGKTPGEDIEIEYIGLRPGEKLYEELFHEKEQLEGTAHEKVRLARHRQVEWMALNATLEQITAACEAMDEAKLLELLHQLVPEHGPKPEQAKKSDSAEVIYLNSSPQS
ncbi:polysaccharide biosynthesis protein [Candidatus Endoriftia persephone]|jgi:FlaA1/EpsC-like NDP-sugar epimerase|nr:nucleoside-diphosphate sugar epimerase/dehydratase [Candidatus Endoriftia persephone]EGW53862.1 putative polysaccharide biosynthesis protein EpsC [endosymbiont of Tevnia jerichonana (vent Tica)]USF87711.1 polysaccharide biosynthesis protein [Candidatus Endoriftia persephone]